MFFNINFSGDYLLFYDFFFVVHILIVAQNICLARASISELQADPSDCTVESFITGNENILSILKDQSETDSYFVGTQTSLQKMTSSGTEILANQGTDPWGNPQKYVINIFYLS